MSIVIIGAGLAGGTAATELREQGYEGTVVLVGAETHPPYERPPLSKGYLLGNDSLEDAFVHPRDWYAEHDVDLRLGVEATGLDTDAHVVSTTGGDLTYERLLLATGAEPRRLAVAEDSGVPTAYLRTIEDSDRLRDAFAAGGRIAVVGAGWIGLEVARRGAAPLAELLEIVQGQRVAGEVQHRVLQDRRVTRREHESVAIGPGWIRRVIGHHAGPQHVRQRRKGHRGALVARVGRLWAVHRQRTHDGDAALFQGIDR